MLLFIYLPQAFSIFSSEFYGNYGIRLIKFFVSFLQCESQELKVKQILKKGLLNLEPMKYSLKQAWIKHDVQ